MYTESTVFLRALGVGGRWPLLGGQESSRTFSQLMNLRRKKKCFLLWLSWQPRPRKSKILMKRKIPTSENNCWRQSAEFLNYRGQENSKQHGSLLCVKQFSKSLRADQTKIGDQKSEMVRDCSKNNRTQNQSIGSLQPQSKSQQWFFF